MTTTLRKSKDGKIVACLESSSGFPAIALVERKCGQGIFRIAPTEVLTPEAIQEDMLIACCAHSAAGRRAAQAFRLRLPTIKPNGYHIAPLDQGGRRLLLVVGGDLFGMLAGLSDALLHSELTPRGLVYRGQARTENPAFSLRYYWTWDHSTNWVLDDVGNQMSGCGNQYLKQPQTYVEDYRRLVDHCIDMRFNGIVIWGFLRNAHGGERYAYEVAKYAADRGVAILPGLGTTGYGGIYYEGRHPCNLETYLAGHPRRGNMWKDGQISARESSPYYPENQKWLAESLEWLYRSFPVGGANMENNDLMVDYSAAGKRGRAKIKSHEADYFKDQYFAYKTALEVAHRLAPQAFNTYATYSGFGRGHNISNAGADMGAEPYFAKRMPPSAIAQWTITGMVSPKPARLRDWMDSPRPAAVYENPRWPKGLCPPTPRSAGFLHQASQWDSPLRRSAVAISTFAEGCLRAHESGLEGISVHGEVTGRTLSWRLNYLTMRHWTYHPVSTLAEFVEAELAPRLGGVAEARTFMECLCMVEDGKHLEAGKIAMDHGRAQFPYNYPARGDQKTFRIWDELREWAHIPHYTASPAQGFTDIL